MTECIKWTDDLSVGIEEIDNEHKTLISILNSFIDAVDDDEGVLVYDSIFGAFLETAIAHFRHEEELMEKSGYEDSDVHKHGHETLLEQLGDMREKLMTSPSDTMEEDVREFLANWLEIHIMVKDQAYGECIRAYLAQQAA